jgi:hypothetical protein
MTTFKTILATAAAVAISATALTSTSAFANGVLFATQSLAPRTAPGTLPQAATNSITTFGLPGSSGTSAPSRPSATPNPPFPLCHKNEAGVPEPC